MSAYFVVHYARLYSVMDTVVISGSFVQCSVWRAHWWVCVECYVIRVADDVCYDLSSVFISVRVP